MPPTDRALAFAQVEPRLAGAIDALLRDPEIRTRFATVAAAAGIGFAGKTMEAGGCLILAEALRTIFGGTLIPISVRDADTDRCIEHVVIALETPGGPRWLDAFGSYEDLDELLAWLEDEAGFDRPDPEAARSAEALATVLLYDQGLVDSVADYLRAALLDEEPVR